MSRPRLPKQETPVVYLDQYMSPEELMQRLWDERFFRESQTKPQAFKTVMAWCQRQSAPNGIQIHAVKVLPGKPQERVKAERIAWFIPRKEAEFLIDHARQKRRLLES